MTRASTGLWSLKSGACSRTWCTCTMSAGATLAPFVACRRLGVPVVLTLHDHWLLCPNNMLYRGNGVSCDPAADAARLRRCFRRYAFWANIPRRRQVFSRLVASVRSLCLAQPGDRGSPRRGGL